MAIFFSLGQIEVKLNNGNGPEKGSGSGGMVVYIQITEQKFSIYRII